MSRLRSKRRPRLHLDIIHDAGAIMSLVDGLFEANVEHAKLSRKIISCQGRLQEFATEDAWIEYLLLEEHVNARLNMMLAAVAEWAFNEGRRSRHPGSR